MIGNNRISAVLVSTDLERAGLLREQRRPDLSPETITNHLLFDCGNGTTLLIYGRGSGNGADHTQVRFWTSDIDKDVAELVGRGIEFEEYDMGAFKTVDHVVTSPASADRRGSKTPTATPSRSSNPNEPRRSRQAVTS